MPKIELYFYNGFKGYLFYLNDLKSIINTYNKIKKLNKRHFDIEIKIWFNPILNVYVSIYEENIIISFNSYMGIVNFAFKVQNYFISKYKLCYDSEKFYRNIANIIKMKYSRTYHLANYQNMPFNNVFIGYNKSNWEESLDHDLKFITPVALKLKK